jgi:large subunit ribosomal protein L19
MATTSKNKGEVLKKVEKSSLREAVLGFTIGDTVNVHCRILEGDKERIQIFNGVVIARRGSGTRENFTVRRIVAGEGVERTFPMNTPKISKLEVVRSGRVRRAKLFFLRDRMGKATRLTERRTARDKAADKATAAEKAAAAE